jgi:ABC-type transport system substrate-binding protein
MGGGYTVIDEIMFRFFHSKSSARFTALADPEYDALVDKARTQVRESDRLKAYHDAQKHFIDKSWYITGWPWQPAYTFVQPWVQNYQYSNTYGFITESYTKLWLKKP